LCFLGFARFAIRLNGYLLIRKTLCLFWKEMTVKGLEPEIQRLILKHKEEVKKIKAIHEAELLQVQDFCTV